MTRTLAKLLYERLFLPNLHVLVFYWRSSPQSSALPPKWNFLCCIEWRQLPERRQGHVAQPPIYVSVSVYLRLWIRHLPTVIITRTQRKTEDRKVLNRSIWRHGFSIVDISGFKVPGLGVQCLEFCFIWVMHQVTCSNLNKKEQLQSCSALLLGFRVLFNSQWHSKLLYTKDSRNSSEGERKRRTCWCTMTSEIKHLCSSIDKSQLKPRETSGSLYTISEVTRSVVNLCSLRDLKVSFERVICSACQWNRKIQLSKQMCKDVQVLVVLFRHMEKGNRWCRTSLSRRQTRRSLHFFGSIPVDAAYFSTFGPAVGGYPTLKRERAGRDEQGYYKSWIRDNWCLLYFIHCYQKSFKCRRQITESALRAWASLCIDVQSYVQSTHKHARTKRERETRRRRRCLPPRQPPPVHVTAMLWNS